MTKWLDGNLAIARRLLSPVSAFGQERTPLSLKTANRYPRTGQEASQNGQRGHPTIACPKIDTEKKSHHQRPQCPGLEQGVPQYGIGARAAGLQPAHLVLTRTGLIDWDTARTDNRASVR